jgi:hypothetical protein
VFRPGASNTLFCVSPWGLKYLETALPQATYDSPILCYLRDDCHKQVITHIRESRRFESIYTLQGKPRPTWHVRFSRQSMYAQRTLPAGSPRTWQPFTSHQQSWAGQLLLRKWAPDTIHSTLDDRPADSYPVYLPSQPMKQWRQIQASIDSRLLGLLGLYHQHVISTFNTCSHKPTHRSLTDTGEGYNIGGATLSHTTPWYSQPVVSTFHIRAPPNLQFNQISPIKPKCWV